MNLFTTLVVFVVMAGLLLLWIRRDVANRKQNLGTIGTQLGLRIATDDAETATWVDRCPAFRFLASGTNMRVHGRLTGVRAGVPFEIVDFHSGSQGSNGSNDFLVFSAMVTTSQSPSFSLMPTRHFEQRLARSDATVFPLLDWSALKDWSLWMHNDPTNPTTAAVSAGLLTVASTLVGQAEQVRVEFLAGHFVAFVRRRGDSEQAEVEQLINNGFALLDALG